MMILPTLMFIKKDIQNVDYLEDYLEKSKNEEKIKSLLMEWSSAISGRISEQKRLNKKANILKVKIPYVLNNQLVMLNDKQEKMFLEMLLDELSYNVEGIQYNNKGKGPFNYFIVYLRD